MMADTFSPELAQWGEGKEGILGKKTDNLWGLIENTHIQNT